MLRINLLPIRQLKKRAQARNQIVSFATLVAFLLLILCAVAFLQTTGIKTIETQISQLEAEKKKLAPILKEMKRFEQARATLENKITIIKKLKRDSATTVHILDDVANKVDTKRMWLKSLKQQGSSLILAGVALDNRTIAQFMDALKKSPYISVVNLANASMIKVSGRNLKSFSLACSIMTPQAKTQQPKK